MQPTDSVLAGTDRAETAPGASSWKGFGGRVSVVVADRERLDLAGDVVAQLIAEVQHRCDARRPASDIARVNAAAGDWVAVDRLTVRAVEAAMTVAAAPARLCGIPRLSRVSLDPAGRLKVAAGGRIDFGETLRAVATDLVAQQVPSDVGTPLIIGIGGDVAVGALPGRPQQWRVTLNEPSPGAGSPERDGIGEEMLLDAGGLATVTLPPVPRGETVAPPLLDPRSGRPVEAAWRNVTVRADSCLTAHAAATTAMVTGDLAPAWLWEHGFAARLIGLDGRVLRLS